MQKELLRLFPNTYSKFSHIDKQALLIENAQIKMQAIDNNLDKTKK